MSKTRTTERLSDIQGYLKTVALLREQIGQARGPEDLVLKAGTAWEWSEKPDGVEYGEAKMCFQNAAHLALTGEYTYCEGWAIFPGGFPMEHAWCLDGDGRVVDVTWRHLDDTCGFCLGNGTREKAVEWDEDGDESGWEEAECGWCGGSGTTNREARDLTGTVYFGVTVEAETLKRVLLANGFYGVLGGDLSLLEAPE